MSDPQFVEKFGFSPPGNSAPPLDIEQVMGLQVLACITILVVVRPPFVTVRDSSGCESVSIAAVASITLTSVAVAWMMHRNGVSHRDVVHALTRMVTQ